MSKEKFDWKDKDAVVIPRTEPIAVYPNQSGDIVIRQGCWPDDDNFVFINPAHAKAVAEAILRVLDEVAADGEKG